MSLIIDLRQLLSSLSACLDFGRSGINRHHQRVAYIGTILAQKYGLPPEIVYQLYLAAIIHDIGVRTWQDSDDLISYDINEPWQHCKIGADLALQVDLFRGLAPIIMSHHDRYCGGNQSGLSGSDIPVASRIIHLADWVDVLLGEEPHVLQRQPIVLDAIQGLAAIFNSSLS